MKKSELIDLLFEEFDREKAVMKKNLMIAMDNVWLQVKDKDMKITIKVVVE